MTKLQENKALLKRLFLLAIPLACQNVISFGAGLADNLMVEKLGENAVSGIYIANQIQNVQQMLVLGLGTTLVILASQYWGKNDAERAKTVIGIIFKFAFFIGLAFFLVGFFFARPILSLLSPDAAVVDQGVDYVRYVCLSYLFLCIIGVLASSMRCVGAVRITMFASFFSFGIDLFLNWVLIFGKLGAPAMGVRGAALSTTIGRIIECSILAIYVFFIDRKLHLKFKDIFRFDKLLLKDIFVYGTPVILGDVLWGLGGVAQAYILSQLGASVMAAASIAGNIHQIFGVVVYGTASAAGIIIGQTVGSGDFDLVRRYTKTLQIVFVCVGIVSSAILFLCKGAVIGLYSTMEPQTVEYALQFVSVMCITLIGTSYQMSTLTGIVRAGGATHFVLINDLIFVWLVVVPSALIASNVFHAPPWVVFACLKSDQILKCIVAAVKVNRFRWIKKLTREDEILAEA